MRTFRNRSAGGLLLLLSTSLVGCESREKPTELRLELPPLIASQDLVAVSVQASDARGVAHSAADIAEYTVQPKDLATVNKAGLLKCEQSGDGTLDTSVLGVHRRVAVHCRIVARIEAANTGRVELAAGAFEPKVRVLDAKGNPLSDVEVSFVSKNSGVAYSKGGQIVPKQVGTATLVARAGQASTEFKVDVVRKVVVEALPIDQNRKLHFSLEPGKYELKIRLPKPHRVSVEWRGAPFCNATSEGLEHTSVCGLRAETGGGVVFDNPSYLNDGSKVPSLDGVELYEVP